MSIPKSIVVRSSTLLSLALSLTMAADQVPTPDLSVEVTAPREGDPLAPQTHRSTPAPSADAGATLRELPGVDGIRMGGLGIDPVIRGQSGSRVLVVTDGACPHGGCPNRMDPPTAYAPAGADQISLDPGGLSVHQAGAAAGTVRMDRVTERFTEQQPVRARADGRYATNGQAREGLVDLSAGQPWGFARGVFHSARANNYSDGDGNEVHSSYRTMKGGGTLGWTPSERTRVEGSVDAIQERDVAFAGAGMDAPTSDGLTSRGRFRSGDLGPFEQVSVDVYRSAVTHEMDNYSLRPLAPGAMAMRAPSTSDTTGGRVDSLIRHSALAVGLGLDAEDLRQDARRYSGMSTANVNALQSVLWPDARIIRVGGYADTAWTLPSDTTVIAGIRIDRVGSSADAADEDPVGAALSPNQLYRAYYGITADSRVENLVGGVLRVDHQWSRHGIVGIALSRSRRAADPTERFIAANGTPTARWVGNPELNAETHDQIQVIADWQESGTGRWRIEGWFDRVRDFIRRDRARGTDGVLLADRATIYHSTEALMTGVVVDGAADLQPWAEIGADAAWTWGQDLNSAVPLAQIPPLSGRCFTRFHHQEIIETTVALRWSSRQTRVDDDMNTGSAVDSGETPAWAVVDWSAGWKPHRLAEMRVGIDNLFDRTYAEHLNKPSAFDTTVQRVNEPGRSFWVGGGMVF